MATSMLADQGADVIKVEDRSAPDPTRNVGPGPRGAGMGAVYVALNRNKRSVALNPAVSFKDAAAVLDKSVKGG